MTTGNNKVKNDLGEMVGNVRFHFSDGSSVTIDSGRSGTLKGEVEKAVVVKPDGSASLYNISTGYSFAEGVPGQLYGKLLS